VLNSQSTNPFYDYQLLQHEINHLTSCFFAKIAHSLSQLDPEPNLAQLFFSQKKISRHYNYVYRQPAHSASGVHRSGQKSDRFSPCNVIMGILNCQIGSRIEVGEHLRPIRWRRWLGFVAWKQSHAYRTGA